MRVKLLGNYLIVRPGGKFNSQKTLSAPQKTALGGHQDGNKMQRGLQDFRLTFPMFRLLVSGMILSTHLNKWSIVTIYPTLSPSNIVSSLNKAGHV
jgi:hypothetical protein